MTSAGLPVSFFPITGAISAILGLLLPTLRVGDKLCYK